MTQGYASDADGDETVMETPEVTVSIDPQAVDPETAFVLLQESKEHMDPWVVGKLVQDNEAVDEMPDIEFHLSADAGIAALASVGVVTLGDQSVEDEAEVE